MAARSCCRLSGRSWSRLRVEAGGGDGPWGATLPSPSRMRRRTFFLGVVILGLAVVPAAGADRETSFSDVPASALKNELTASIALTSDGAMAAVWSSVTVPGALQGAARVGSR